MKAYLINHQSIKLYQLFSHARYCKGTSMPMQCHQLIQLPISIQISEGYAYAMFSTNSVANPNPNFRRICLCNVFNKFSCQSQSQFQKKSSEAGTASATTCKKCANCTKCHKEKAPVFSCDQCDKKYGSAGWLKRHKQSVYGE